VRAFRHELTVGGYALALRHAFPRTTKEPALSRRPRHRASAVASRGELGTDAARHAPSERRRARTILGLSFACGALLIAVPIALVIGGSSGGSGATRDPDGIFTGEDDGTTDGGTGRGGGLSTTSTESPSPPDPGDAAANGSATPAGGGAANAGGGTAAQPGGGAAAVGGTTGSGTTGSGTTGSGTTGSGSGGTAAGSNGGSGSGSGGSGGGSNPVGGSNPPPAQPEPEPEPCPCEKVGDALEDPVGTVEDTLGGVVPKLPDPLG
jgi:hypothetical protein